MKSYYFIFKRPDNTYYFKLKGYAYYLTHTLHSINQYRHEIVLIIPINSGVYKFSENFAFYKKRIKRKIIRLLEKI